MGLSINDVSGIGAVSGLIKDVADKIWPDPAERDAYLQKAQELDNQLAQGQMAIDQAEAASSNMFVAGWRPAVGWCCAAAFCYHLILQPTIVFIAASMGHIITLPMFNEALLSDTLYGMLGLGVMRTTEKMGAKGHLPWQK
jgi:hypothetical protein